MMRMHASFNAKKNMPHLKSVCAGCSCVVGVKKGSAHKNDTPANHLYRFNFFFGKKDKNLQKRPNGVHSSHLAASIENCFVKPAEEVQVHHVSHETLYCIRDGSAVDRNANAL